MPARFIAFVLLFVAPAIWAAVPCTIYTRSSDGDDADDGSSWALANATLEGSLADWGTSDVICVEDNHSQTQASDLTLSATGDTFAIMVPIYSVSDADDSYSVAGATQVATTGNNDIIISMFAAIHGIRFSAGDDIIFTAAFQGRTRDVYWLMTSLAGRINMSNPGADWEISGGTVEFSHASGGYVLTSDNRSRYRGVTFAGNAYGLGLFATTSNGYNYLECVGCDLSAYSGMVVVDISAAGDDGIDIHIIGSVLPATFTPDDSSHASPGQNLWISGSDDTTGDEGFRQDLYAANGDVTTDTTVYHDAGLVFTEGSTSASLKFEPASHVSVAEPLCSPGMAEWINSTGSTTWTTELVENWTSALTVEEVWQEIYYLGTSGSPRWTLDLGQSVGDTTALTAGTGLANWTGEPAGSRSVKLTTTATINKAGYYSIRWCVGAYEASKVVHVDARPSIS